MATELNDALSECRYCPFAGQKVVMCGDEYTVEMENGEPVYCRYDEEHKLHVRLHFTKDSVMQSWQKAPN